MSRQDLRSDNRSFDEQGAFLDLAGAGRRFPWAGSRSMPMRSTRFCGSRTTPFSAATSAAPTRPPWCRVGAPCASSAPDSASRGDSARCAPERRASGRGAPTSTSRESTSGSPDAGDRRVEFTGDGVGVPGRRCAATSMPGRTELSRWGSEPVTCRRSRSKASSVSRSRSATAWAGSRPSAKPDGRAASRRAPRSVRRSPWSAGVGGTDQPRMARLRRAKRAGIPVERRRSIPRRPRSVDTAVRPGPRTAGGRRRIRGTGSSASDSDGASDRRSLDVGALRRASTATDHPDVVRRPLDRLGPHRLLAKSPTERLCYTDGKVAIAITTIGAAPARREGRKPRCRGPVAASPGGPRLASTASGTSCESGGTGRRAGLRIQWGNSWGFKSPLSHVIR